MRETVRLEEEGEEKVEKKFRGLKFLFSKSPPPASHCLLFLPDAGQ